ncbi:MAG: tetratricopeptide repeat protein [Anaerolineae bacterium]|nr:tetratricopeptide repeat protein [Anaerolineae bacterium]
MDLASLQETLESARSAQAAQDYDRALAGYDRLLARSEGLGVDDTEARELRLAALRERSRLVELQGDPEEALRGLEQYYLEAGSSEHAVEALNLIGDLHDGLGQERRALAAYEEALALAEAFNYTPGRAKALLGAGLTWHHLGRTEEGISQLQKALALLEQIGDEAGQMRATNRLGIAYVQAGQVDKAIDWFEKSLVLARNVGVRETAIDLNNIGECYQLLFNSEQALAHHQEAYALAQSTGLRSALPDLARNLGYDLFHLGQVEKGVGYLEVALRLATEMSQHDVRMQALYTLAQAEVRRGKAAEARQYAQQLQQLAQERDYRVYQAEALYALGLVEQLEKNDDMAEQRWQEALFLAHEAGRQYLLWQVHASLAEIAANAGLARVHYQIAAEIINQIAYPIEDEAVRAAFLSAAPVKRILEHSG